MDYSDSPSMDYEQLFNHVIRFDELEGQLNKTWDSTTLAQTIPAVSEVPNGIGIVSVAACNQSDYHDGPPDLTLISSDGVHFPVHLYRLMDASISQFGQLIYPDLNIPLHLPEDASTLNILIHVVYGIPFAQYNPLLETLLEVVKSLKKYGILLTSHLNPGNHLFEEITKRIPQMPLEVFTIAAGDDIFELACEASKHLLSFPLNKISDQVATRMGSIYLRLLFTLHTERLFVLRRLVASPPVAHEPIYGCGRREYERLRSAWSLASVTFIHNAKPDIPAALLNSTLDALKFTTPCTECQQAITRRVQEVVVKWSLTPKTIRRNAKDFSAVLSPTFHYIAGGEEQFN